MTTHRLSSGVLLLLVAAFGLTGCEPYMSLTDRIPTQTRQAITLLPEAPRYAGMVDLETVMGQANELTEINLADSLRQADESRLGTFLDATGMDPETDLKAAYGALGDGRSGFSAVVFADLTPTQMDRYLDQAPDGAGQATTYRDVPVYHLVAGDRASGEGSESDTLSLGFVRSGTIAAAVEAERVEAMIDRHKDETGGFRENESYMTLVERVGHGSTAWLVGRDVLQTALQDTATGDTGARSAASEGAPAVNGAGFQQLLSMWADRMLGLSDASSALEGSSGGKVERLKGQIREQAVSVTLTGETIEGEAYLTMRDETSASNVVDVSKGAIAALRLSEEVHGLMEDLLDEVTIERDGPIVHVQFAVGREHLQKTMERTREERAAHRSKSSVRQAKGATRRLDRITRTVPALGSLRVTMRACNLCADRPVSHTAGRGHEHSSAGRG